MTRNARFLLAALWMALPPGAVGQIDSWTEITMNYSLPPGVRIFRGERANPLLRAFYIDVDLNQPSLAVRPYLSTTGSGTETIPQFLQRVGGYAGVNGGYFGGSTSYSAVVYPGEILARNIETVTRTPNTYYVTRAFFGLTTRKLPAIDWIFHFGPALGDLYRFSQPAQNLVGTPAPRPLQTEGSRYDSLLAGIGGGPMLVKAGQLRYTYDEEVFWGSGVDGPTPNPRTAVGFTAANHVILLVADGRQASSSGVTLPELASICLALDCVEAMNLDGGGSTQMAARTASGTELVDAPSESRAVPTMLTVVHADSLKGAGQPIFEKTIDTGDPGCSLIGPGWFESANQTWWGTTRAQLAPIGTGDKQAIFTPSLPRRWTYDVSAWWVAATNRSANTPFIIRHANGTDTVRVNQQANGSKWVKIGTFPFAGDTTDRILISNAASTGQYVCADAVRIATNDPLFLGIPAEERQVPTATRLEQNYPNPFNPTTTIAFQLAFPSEVRLKVFDLLGREVATLADGEFPPGRHRVRWSAVGLAGGPYFCRLQAGSHIETRPLLLMR